MFGHVRELLTAYHHGELSIEDRRRVESHISKCEKCRKESEDIGDVVRLVARGLHSHGALQSSQTQAYASKTSGLRWVLVPAFLFVLMIGIYAWRQTRLPAWDLASSGGAVTKL